MMGAVLEDMKRKNIRTVGYIGFADAWGESVYKTLIEQGKPAGLDITSNERYQRNDVSVTMQALKIMTGKPDAVVVGGSGAPGALPHAALRERGYKGLIYNTHGSVSGDFIRIGGKNAEGAIAPAGPFLFAGQLPQSNPVKSIATEYLGLYDKSYGVGARSPFAGYAFDAFLILNAAMPEALKHAKPGTPEFRTALRAALEGNVKGVVGTQGVYSMTPADHNGLDGRARVLVEVQNGKWVLKND
jgi:branched-chain amino acid transport system substrate-binding protein